MAKIYEMPNQAEWDAASGRKNGKFDPRGKFDFDAQERLFKKLPADKLIELDAGADGCAVYYVQSLKPLVVCHVPYLDAYRAHPLIEKGLNVAEVKKMLAARARFKKLWEPKSKIGGANGRE